jgi:bile acid:Na+ symporter, BASS family
LSPLTAWLVFSVIGFITPDSVSGLLAPLSARFVVGFFALWVILPAATGSLFRCAMDTDCFEKIKPKLKLLNLVVLLILNYANASLSLPDVLRNPDAGYLVIITILTALLCVANFGSASIVSRLFQVDSAERASLFFALGMTNNGAGLVLVASASAAAGEIMLPLILYNLAQHLGAGIVDRFLLQDRS